MYSPFFLRHPVVMRLLFVTINIINPGPSGGYRPVETRFTPESPNRTLVNPVLGAGGKLVMAETVVSLRQQEDNIGHLTELKVER